MSKKGKIIIGNWKMNPSTAKEAEKLFSVVVQGVSAIKKTEIVICPPFVYLERLKKLSRKINLGAQDAFWEEKGAFTGEVSADMLSNLGVKYVILGHSERRAMGENNLDVNKKIKASLAAGLTPVLCVGENMRDESHGYFNLVKAQLEECLDGIKKELISKVIIAYEPVWAISSTINRHDATSADCREMSIFIRKVLSDKLGVKMQTPRILYGGSVDDKSVGDFLRDGGVDGVLVGRTSLDGAKFSEIVKICEALNK
ncbi:MAG: triose-phosphate isomerase [Patescibacteria group bacterium]